MGTERNDLADIVRRLELEDLYTEYATASIRTRSNAGRILHRGLHYR